MTHVSRPYPGDEVILNSLKRLVSGVLTHPITIGKKSNKNLINFGQKVESISTSSQDKMSVEFLSGKSQWKFHPRKPIWEA